MVLVVVEGHISQSFLISRAVQSSIQVLWMGKKNRRNVSTPDLILQTVKKEKPETVRELIILLRTRSNLPEDNIMDHILELQNRGKLTFQENPKPPTASPKAYLLSSQTYWFWITTALVIAAATSVFTIPEDAFPLVYSRYLLGSLFVLFLPGYSFIKALFPRKVPIPTRSEELDNIERIALSIGMSLALVPITGLLLNYTPWGIRVTPVTLSLLALTLAFAIAAVIREFSLQNNRTQ